MKYTIAALCAALLSAAPVAAADPLSSLRYLVGTWSCSYNAGKNHITYKAVYAYDMANNWMRESDSWAGGGNDLGMLTYDPKHHGWTAVIVEPERSATIFRSDGGDYAHIVYHSMYPDTSMTEVFDRQSQTRYTLHFTQTGRGRTIKSTDLCLKT